MNNRTVCIRTFGCQMNVRDSEVIAGLLTANDYEIISNPDDADVIIFNTCSVRQHAEDKVWSEIGRYSKGHKVTRSQGHKKIIGLVGCMAQNYKEEAFKRAPALDFVVGPSDIDKIPGILESFIKTGAVPLFQQKIWETEGETRPEEIYHTGFHEDNNHAYVVISEGCSNYCSYCVVPYVRGGLRNRNHEDILREIKEAVDKGINSITLLGQNVNSYMSQGQPFTALRAGKVTTSQVNFVELLKLINTVKCLKEFSFITSHPKDTSIELFKAMAECEKLKKYLHLPVQSGSDRILKLMNRRYTGKFYLDLASNYRKIVKGGALTTDIIVGYPGETEEDFRDTYNLVKDIGFDAAYIFKYSPRPHTAAAEFNDDVPKSEKERRHALILELQKGISRKK